MAIEIVDFPMKKGGSFHSYVSHYQRVQTRYDPWILQVHPTAGRWASMGLAPEVQH